MEATKTIITSPADFAEPPKDIFADRRQPFVDAELRSLDNLTSNQPNNMFSPEKVAKVASDTGLTDVVRWKPRMVRSAPPCLPPCLTTRPCARSHTINLPAVFLAAC